MKEVIRRIKNGLLTNQIPREFRRDVIAKEYDDLPDNLKFMITEMHEIRKIEETQGELTDDQLGRFFVLRHKLRKAGVRPVVYTLGPYGTTPKGNK